MNINKFTQKSLQAVQDCEKVALEYGNQEIEQEHLLYALLVQDDSLILKLMEKMGTRMPWSIGWRRLSGSARRCREASSTLARI